MSDAVLLGIARLLHLLTGWKVPVQLLFPCLLLGPHLAVLPWQGAGLSSRCGSNDLPGKPSSLAGLKLYQVLPMKWFA